MKINMIEIYKVDKYNWTYDIYKDNKIKSSGNYFGNSKKCIEWCRQVLVDDVLSEAIDFEDAMNKLNELQEKIDCIIKVKNE